MSNTQKLLDMQKQIESLLFDYDVLAVDYVSGPNEPRHDDPNPYEHQVKRKEEREKLYALLKAQHKTIRTLRNRHHKVIIQHAKWRDTL